MTSSVTRAWHRALWVLVVMSSVWFIACDRHETITGPTSIVGFSIVGTGMVPLGGTVALKAIGDMSDGSTQDVTDQVAWMGGQTREGPVFVITGPGVVRGVGVGETQIFATLVAPHVTNQRSLNVLVLEAGTYRLSGTIRDSGLVLSHSIVTVTSGRGAGLSATTDGQGVYRLYGVAGDIDVQVATPDYQPATRHLTVADNTVADFDLAPVTPRLDLTGTYDMTITTDPSCSVQLPEATHVRRYTAAITQNGGLFNVLLAGANFVVRSGHGHDFTGHVTSSGVTFAFLDDEFDLEWPNVFESLAADQFLTLSGDGTLSPDGTGFSGSWRGTYTVSTNLGSFLARTNVHQCFADGHRIALARSPSSPARR